MRSLEIRRRGCRAAQLTLRPMPQPNATHRANGHAARGQPGDDDERDDERKAQRHSSSGDLPRLSSRSKYTRSMRRRRTRSTTMRNPACTWVSPDLGTRPNSAYTRPPTVVTSSTAKIGVQSLGQFVDRHAARDPVSRRSFLLDLRLLDVVLVANLADDLLENVFNRHEARRAAVLVAHDRRCACESPGIHGAARRCASTLE